jgi:peptidoglycan/xylan/chitin deacetylase (PgdA/CDA1 family)
MAREVSHSRLWLERTFGIQVDVFCYPFGRYDARVVNAVRRAGYAAAETENVGLASPADGLFRLDRMRVLPTTGVAGLAASLGDSRAGQP